MHYITTESTGDVYAVQFHNDIIVSSHEVGGIRLWYTSNQNTHHTTHMGAHRCARVRSMADGTLIGEDDSLPLISRIVVDRGTF